MKAGMRIRLGMLLGVLSLWTVPLSVQAADGDNLFSHVDEAQIRPIKDGSV